MMKTYIVLAIVYMIAGNECQRYSYPGAIEEFLLEDARNEELDKNEGNIIELNHRVDDALNTRRKRLSNDDNDGVRPISFDPVVPEEEMPAPPVDHGSSQVGLNCDNNGCANDGKRPVSFDEVKPQEAMPVPPAVEHGSSQAGLNKSEEHDPGKVPSPGVSTTEVSSTTKQVQKTEPGRGHVVRPGCAPILVLLNIILIYYYTANII